MLAFRCASLGAAIGLAVCCSASHAAEPLKNHYNDPFVQVTNARKSCPTPRGPLMTEREAKADAHQRIERGTTCFNAGKCTQANAYFYDAEIAKRLDAAARAAIARDITLARSSVWFTVQRRFVFVQGCVSQRGHIARWEAIAKQAPDVDYVSVDLLVGTRPANGRMPYPVQ